MSEMIPSTYSPVNLLLYRLQMIKLEVDNLQATDSINTILIWFCDILGGLRESEQNLKFDQISIATGEDFKIKLEEDSEGLPENVTCFVETIMALRPSASSIYGLSVVCFHMMFY